MNRKLMLVLLVLGVVLIVAAGVIYVVFVRETGPAKPPEVEMPPSLEEWAEKYPRLEDVLNNSELGSAYKEFLAVYEEEGETAAMELARERGILVTDGGEEYVYLILILDTEEHEPVVAEMEAYGARVFSAHQDRVSVGVPVEMVKQQLGTEDPGAIFEDLTGFEHVIAVRLPEPMIPNGSEIDGEGVDVIDADAWHAAGITGAGLRIGVLDLGFDNYRDLLGEELPGEVTYNKFGVRLDEGEVVHGTACAEIVHEVAPDATLILVEYGGDDVSFGEAVDWLVEQDVDIISHSANGLLGPRDGSGWDAQLVDDLATTRGILWVNSAGNEALGHYRAEFTDNDGDGFHDFASGDRMLPVQSYTGDYIAVLLQWQDDWDRPTQDYQLHVYDENGDLLGSSLETQSGALGQEPYEALSGNPGGDFVYAVVEAYDVDGPVPFDIFVVGGEVGAPSAGHSLGTPADARYSLTVGAANWEDDSLAEYSSQGPTDDGRLKPEISAPTGVSGASYGRGEFDGTSSSCPHVAGAAALVWQAHPAFTRQETVDYLLTNAVDLGPDGPDTAFGYGRLQLPGAIDPSVDPSPAATIDPSTTPGPMATVPVPTEVTYTIPTQVPTPEDWGTGGEAGLLALAGVGVVVVGLGCAGGLLLFVGAIGLLVMRGRRRRGRPVAPPVRPVLQTPPAQPEPQTESCRHCGAVVRAGARFCPSCGQSLAPAQSGQQTQACPHCGASMRAGGRFCPRCGQPAQ